MAPRRALRASGFDIVVQHADGAFKLHQMIHKNRAEFQAAKSLFIQISEAGFDEFEDDQWAMVLESIRPENVKHNLKHVKIEIIGEDKFSGYLPTISAPSTTSNLYTAKEKPPLSRRNEPLVSRNFERAFIKALANVRDIEKVEISGPMEAQLKKRLAVAMTTRTGGKVRDWRYGGSLRSDDDISVGTWSAVMQETDEEESYAATAYKKNGFRDQVFLPAQPQQILAIAKYDEDGRQTITRLGPVGQMIKPKAPMDLSADDEDTKLGLPSSGNGPKAAVFKGSNRNKSAGSTGYDAGVGNSKIKEEEINDGNNNYPLSFERNGDKRRRVSSGHQASVTDGKLVVDQTFDDGVEDGEEYDDASTSSSFGWTEEEIPPDDDPNDEDFEP